MNIESLQRKVREAISDIEDALRRGAFAMPKEGCPTNSDLRYILQQLHRINSEIAKSEVPLKAERTLWIGRIITDDWWNFRSEPLTNILMCISNAYLRELP
jgi:hypothetical protein